MIGGCGKECEAVCLAPTFQAGALSYLGFRYARGLNDFGFGLPQFTIHCVATVDAIASLPRATVALE
jgi:hypothetical protein